MTAPTSRTSVELSLADRIAIVAGSGRLPADVAEGLKRRGIAPLVLAVEGEADQPFAGFEVESLKLGEVAPVMAQLKRRGITHIVLAGGISRRPRLGELRFSWLLLRHLPRALLALRRGDDGLLGALIASIEREGVRVVGAHQIVPDLLAPEGVLGRHRPGLKDQADLRAGYAAAKALGALDIGQGAVSIGGRVIAVEGIEGTDCLLERVRDLRGHGRLAGKAGGVLVKCSKPGQELRADLPAIGPQTVERAYAAGLAGIGVEAEHSLVLEGAQMIERADRLGLFVVGLPAGGPT